MLKYVKPSSEKIVVVFGNTEEGISYNRSILLHYLLKHYQTGACLNVLETSIRILDHLSQTWDECTDTLIRNSIHKIVISKENGLKIDSRLIGFSEIDKNLLFQSITDPDELEKLFKSIGLAKEFVKVTETFNTILLLNKFDFIEGGINDRFRIRTGLPLTRFCKLNDIKESEFIREF